MTRRPHLPVTIAALVIAAFVIAACGTTAPSASQRAGAGAMPLEVTAQQANDFQKAGDLVLDVREPSEWAAGHIEGATLIPLGQLPSRLAELPKDRSIVVVCRSGNRSAQGRDLLRDAGFQSVTSMAGGMNAWLAAGLPIVTGS